MNATTPPKLMPPFHKTAANGTLLTEQTNDAIATTGPIIGPQIAARTGLSDKKKAFQNSFGTQAPNAQRSKADRDILPNRSPIHDKVMTDGGKPFFRKNPLPQ